MAGLLDKFISITNDVALENLAEAEALAAGIREQLAPRCLIGCHGEAIVGNDREVERVLPVVLQ